MSKKPRVEGVLADGTTDVRTSPSEDICHAKDGAGAEDICNGEGTEKSVNDLIPAQSDSDFIVHGNVSGISIERGECVETAISCLGSEPESNFTAAREVSSMSSGPTGCAEKAVHAFSPAQLETNVIAAMEVSDISSEPGECGEKAFSSVGPGQNSNFFVPGNVSGISSEPAEHVNIMWSSECTVVAEAEMVQPVTNVQERCDEHALENTPIVRAKGCVAVDEESSIPMEGELQLHTRPTKRCSI